MKNITFLSSFFKLGACDDSICGRDAVCEEEDGKTKCSCPEGMTGDPFIECREFLLDLDLCDIIYTYLSLYPDSNKIFPISFCCNF